ncbi:flavoprotein [Kocuria sp. CPCC 205268]|uniref:flavoprotein n=1 Tax=Kocuria oxytropis TaxID=3058913 RepID=UPI0034D4DF00
MSTSPSQAPIFSADRLHLHVTGSVNAALVPHWLNWLRIFYPDLTVSMSVTHSALRFVTLDSLRLLSSGSVWIDAWDSPDIPSGVHNGLDEDTECFGIFPATLNTTMRLAAGLSDSPMLMALQLTRRPIAVATSFPGTNPLIDQRLEDLQRRNNIIFTPQVPAYSVSQDQWKGGTGFFMPFLLETLETKLSAPETTRQNHPA